MCAYRPDGALVVLVPSQVSPSGLYRPPASGYFDVFKPPQTIISVPVHTAVCDCRASGALIILVASQLFVPGLYRPPVLTEFNGAPPPQTIISVPVHTAVCR